jgi:FeS assembly protein IscX
VTTQYEHYKIGDKRKKIMKWTDSREIAIALYETYPNTNPLTIRFTDLHAWVIALDGFADAPNNSNEQILEAIQMMWIDEAD